MESERRNSFKLRSARLIFRNVNSASKENRPAPAAPEKPQLPVNSLIVRRVTYPSVYSEQEQKENLGPSRQRDGSVDGARKPLSNLSALNKNLQQIFHSRSLSEKTSTAETVGKQDQEAESSDSDFFIDASQDTFYESFVTTNQSYIKQNEEKLLYSDCYLQESIDLQLLDFAERMTSRDTHLSKPLQKMRSTVVDWVFAVQMYFKLPDMVPHIAIQILDHSLRIMEVKEKDMQLIGGAAFWLASKIECNGGLPGRKMKKIIGKSCSMDRLKSAEVVIFKMMNYCIPRDSAHSLLNYQLHILKPELQVDEEMLMIGQYVLETSLLYWTISISEYSLLASMATMCTILLSGQIISDSLWEMKARIESSFVSQSEAANAALDLLCKLQEIQRIGSHSGNLWLKFATTEKMGISRNPKLSSETIGRILKKFWGVQ